MIRFKHHNSISGFSLIEAIIALLILSVLFGSIFTFQSQLIRGVFRAHGIIEHIPALKNALIAIERDQLYEKDGLQKIENKETNTQITYQTSKINEASALGKIKNLKKETIIAEWPNLLSTAEIEIIGFRFVPTIAGKK